MTKNKSLKIIIRILVLVLVIGGIGRKYYLTINQEVDPVYYGEIFGQDYDVYSKVSGIITELNIDVGNTISKNQIIGQIDDRKVRYNYEKALVSREISGIQENVVTSPIREEEINIQENLVAQLNTEKESISSSLNKQTIKYQQLLVTKETLQKTYDLYVESYEDIKVLYESGIETENSYNRAELAKEEALQNLNYNALQIEDINNDISSLRAQVKAIDLQIASANEQLTMMGTGGDISDQEIAGLQDDAASIEVEQLAFELEEYKIKSYNKGIVSTVNYEIGEYVSVGTPIISIIDDENQRIKIYVKEKNLSLISIGDDLLLVGIYDETIEVNGKVINIASEAMYTPSNIVTVEDREKLVYEVEIEIPNNDYLKLGMLLEVNLNTITNE